MKTAKRIFVYTEDTPVRRDVVAHGMYRALSPLLRSIRDHIDGIAIYSAGLWFEDADTDPELAPLCVRMPRLPTLFCKALQRHPALDRGISKALPPRLLASAVRRSPADTLLSSIGASASTLIRGARLAAQTGRSHAVYLVDDFIAPLRHQPGVTEAAIRRTMAEAGEALRGASHVFTITEGLGEHVRNTYGVSSTTTLGLAFEPSQRPEPPVKDQIIFVGSINYLYIAGLQDLFKAVEHVRNHSGVDLTVRLTMNADICAQMLGALPSFVVAAPIATAEGLASEIASSLFAFLPYTFDPQHKNMVSTSFPSKSIEYLAYARSIVVYGPDYGVATLRFRTEALPTVTSSPAELEETIRTHMAAHPDHSSLYRRQLASSHSIAAARKTLCTSLGLETRDV